MQLDFFLGYTLQIVISFLVYYCTCAKFLADLSSHVSFVALNNLFTCISYICGDMFIIMVMFYLFSSLILIET